MEKILYFECLSGISGDMTIGALLDLGGDEQHLRDELKKLKLDGYHLHIDKKSKNGIFGTKFDVCLDHHHDHDHDHDHEHDHEHEHHHRNFRMIKEMILTSELSDSVKKLSIKIFEEVARAEAKIHHVTIDEVHFHEVGAIDSIVDIVGAAILIEQLNVDKIYASPLHVGTGFVNCAHGKIPVPAPATLEILKGIPVYSKGIRSELVTPTGAAIIKVLADDFMDRPEMTIESIGYGLGTKDLEVANLLRVNLAKKKV